MSGGSMDYLYQRVREAAEEILYPSEEESCKDEKRIKFANHLFDVAKALREIECVDSGDMSPGEEHEAIDDVMECEFCGFCNGPVIVKIPNEDGSISSHKFFVTGEKNE